MAKSPIRQPEYTGGAGKKQGARGRTGDSVRRHGPPAGIAGYAPAGLADERTLGHGNPPALGTSPGADPGGGCPCNDRGHVHGSLGVDEGLGHAPEGGRRRGGLLLGGSGQEGQGQGRLDVQAYHAQVPQEGEEVELAPGVRATFLGSLCGQDDVQVSPDVPGVPVAPVGGPVAVPDDEGTPGAPRGPVPVLSGGVGGQGPPSGGLDTPTLTAQKPGKRELRCNRYRLDWAAADRQVEKCEKCGKLFRVWHHLVCGARIVAAIACNSRVCPKCAPRRAADLVAQYTHAIRNFRLPTLLTLTVQNVFTAAELPEALDRLVGGFLALRRRKVWPKKAPGIWALEIVWTEEKGYHPHLHVIVDLPRIDDLQELARVWTDLTGAKHQPDVKRAWSPEKKAGLLREGVKYITKAWEVQPGKLDASGEEPIRAILAVLAGRRAVQPFGDLVVEEIDRDGSSDLECPRCHQQYHRKDWKSCWEMWDVDKAEMLAMKFGPLWADFYDGWARAAPAAPLPPQRYSA